MFTVLLSLCIILSPPWKQTAKLVFEKTDNLHKFCTIKIFVRLLHLVTFTADVGILTTIDYYDWLLFHGRIRDHTKIQLFNLFQSGNLQMQMTIRSCQQQTNGLIAEFTQSGMHFKISTVEVFCRGFVPH